MSDPSIPDDVAIALRRALVWSGREITDEQREIAFAWVDEHNQMEEMGG